VLVSLPKDYMVTGCWIHNSLASSRRTLDSGCYTAGSEVTMILGTGGLHFGTSPTITPFLETTHHLDPKAPKPRARRRGTRQLAVIRVVWKVIVLTTE
jgi:hypothetical protein